jgi:hypothetical protein
MTAAEAEEQLALDIGSFWDNPLGYVMYSFPWQVKGTRLQAFAGPDVWQREFLEDLGREIKKNGFDPAVAKAVEAVMMSTASGHGIGKSGLVGMLCCFLLDTRPHSRGIGTANTGKQLKTRTFPEVVKWRELSITAHWWEVSTADMWVRHKDHPSSWRFDAITWKKEESEAFAGQHAITSSSFYIFDEASAVDDKIYEVAQGGLTDGEPFFFMFGNPTRNQGYFFRSRHVLKHRFIVRSIDSRTCAFPNKKQMEQWIEDYGIDSDFVRVRVLGLDPKAGDKQFIPNDLVARAQTREVETFKDDVLVLGVDPARFGEDESVIYPRVGLDARTLPILTYRGLDTMQLASKVAEYCEEKRLGGLPVAAIFVDGGGVGAGVVDRLRQLGHNVIEVNFGGKSPEERQDLNMTAYMWRRMKAWLERGAIPDESTLADQLTHREYDYTDKEQLYLERKKDMKARGLESPDRADGLCLTFAQVVAARPPRKVHGGGNANYDYDPLEVH